MSSYSPSIFLICFLWCTYSNHVYSQGSSSPLSLPDTSSTLDTSCDKLVSPDEAYGFVRILEKDNSQLDILQVNVEIEFQVAGHEPCTETRTTPIELHLPKGPFSVKMNRQQGQNQFQFSIHRKRLGPIVFMKDVNTVCMAYDEEWLQPTWC